MDLNLMDFNSKYSRNPFGSKRKSIIKQNQNVGKQKKSRQKKSRQKKSIKNVNNRWFDDSILLLVCQN